MKSGFQSYGPTTSSDTHGDGSKSTWTVMVYAGLFCPQKSLSRAARDDLAEMQMVGSNDQVTILVQVDDKTVGMPRRYACAERRPRLPVRGYQTDRHGQCQGAEAFWRGDSRYDGPFPPGAVGSSYRYAFGFDASSDGDSSTSPRCLEFWTGAGDGRGGTSTSWDSFCLRSERDRVAYQFRNSVDYLVASEVGVPFMGWPYATISNESGETVSLPGDVEQADRGLLRIESHQSLMLAALNLAEHPGS